MRLEPFGIIRQHIHNPFEFLGTHECINMIRLGDRASPITVPVAPVFLDATDVRFPLGRFEFLFQHLPAFLDNLLCFLPGDAP